MPRRIQRRRTAGWRMPPGAVYVGRPTRWGNPYRVIDGLPKINASHQVWDAAEAVALFREDLLAGTLPITVEDVRRELRGHDLACWCRTTEMCHADVLLEIANASN